MYSCSVGETFHVKMADFKDSDEIELQSFKYNEDTNYRTTATDNHLLFAQNKRELIWIFARIIVCDMFDEWNKGSYWQETKC